MTLLRYSLITLALGAVVFGSTQAAQGQGKQPNLPNFGVLTAPGEDAIKTQAQAWLKDAGKADAATQAKFNSIWSQKGDLVDRVEQTLTLGDAQAAKLLAEARSAQTPAPTAVPEILTSDKTPAFVRGNLALTYARHLIHRRVYEEALEVLKAVQPDSVCDPASYLFHKAVCEHGMLKKEQAAQSINQLVEDVAGAPERYKTVAVLMLLDMQAWRAKDLGEIARKMENVERRLDLARGGPQTQKLQKEIIMRLDEIIKEMENKKGGGGQCNGGGCPNGSQPGTQPGGGNNPSSPMPDSILPQAGGKGDVTPANLRKLRMEWGRLPEGVRQQQLRRLTASMSPAHRDAVENYFRNLPNAKK